MIADDKARIENSAEMEMVSGERFRTNRQRQVKEEDLPDMRKEKELKIRDKNKVTEGILWTAPPTSEDTKKKVEPKNMATSKTSKTNPVELSKQDHSVNKATQKENVKTAKKRKTGKISSQDNIQQQRPLPKSNQTHGKSVPLPPVVSTRVSYSAQGGTDRSVQRSHNQVSQKQKSSSSNTPTPLIPKSSYNLNYISYSHMFNELPSQQGAGPVIQEMFPSTIYGNVPNFRGEISSASATGRSRSGSIRDHSARLKRSELNEKTPSPPNLLSKQEGIEMGPNKTDMVNSGTNWAIRSNKHGGIHGIQALDKMTDAKHQNSELPIIIEASTENSITDTGTFKETLKTMNFLDKRSINVVCNNSENVDTDLPKEAGGVQQNFSFINSSCRRDTENVQVPKSGRTPPPSKDLSARETPSQLQPDEALEDWGNSHGYQGGHSVEPKYDEEDKCFSPRSTEGSHNPAGSGHLSAKPGSCFKSITLTAKISTGSQNGKDGADHYEFQEGHQEQVDADPSLTKYLSYTSNGSLTEEESGLHHKQSSIIWIRGAVLGRGAYGTVYRGLTNQGELIAAKQVRILDSGPELVRKEYKKLQEEVDLLKTLTHPNIVGYLGTSFEDSVVTIFMEFVPGGSISSNLSQFGPLKEAVISKYTSHILQGTSYLHKNRVVHRDIKGNNVMLMPNGVIKLIDFGCAKRLNSLSINGTRGKKLYSLKGTPYWMAPEVISESGHEEKSDIWSIGCTVYEMATGKPPLAHMDRLVAMFYIGADKGPMPILPDHFSKHAREFVNLCFTRDQDIRPSAEQLLQHPFVCLT
ncbi:mitogen-activated protein kinase kinase kinase 19 isoform X2 [Dendropsophus ebraccatus]